MARTATLIDFPPDRIRRPVSGSRSALPDIRPDDRAELISALLLAMEDAPLTPTLCYPVRDISARAHVIVTVGRTPFRLRPDECRAAARMLDDEQAFPGCSGVAADLREAAYIAEARPVRTAPPTSYRWRTGMASTVFLFGLLSIAFAYGVAAWAFR